MYKTNTVIVYAVFIVCVILRPVAALAATEGTSNAIQTSQPSVHIALSGQKDSAIRLEARQAPLGQVLKEITAKTGAIIHYSVLPQEPVTATCVGANVKQVMECLLGSRVDRIYRKPPKLARPKANIFAANAKIQPEEIWLLGSHFGDAVNTMQCTLDGSLKTVSTAENNQNSNTAVIRMAQINNDPRFAELRKQALSLLAAQGKTGDTATDDEVVETLHQALADQDPEVRAQAVFGLSQQDSGNTNALHDALQDNNADVRLMAVDGANGGDPQTQAILNEALNDSDATVRAAASYKLGIEFSEPENN